jgi:hypothetical protein
VSRADTAPHQPAAQEEEPTPSYRESRLIGVAVVSPTAPPVGRAELDDQHAAGSRRMLFVNVTGERMVAN